METTMELPVMTKRKLPKYLSMNYNTYVVTLDIPKDVRAKFGNKPRWYKSLQTDSLSKAENRKWKFIDEWKALIKAARTGKTYLDQMRVLLATDTNEEDRYWTVEALRDTAIDIAQDGDPSAMDALKTATGEWVLLEEHLGAWEQDTRPHVAAKTLDMQRSDIKRLLSRFTYLHDITPETAKDHLESFDVSVSTKKRILSAWRSFLTIIGQKNLLRDVSFEQERRRTKQSKKDKRQPFSDSQIRQLLDNANDQQLHDLIMLAAYTGARIEELCSLETQDVTDRVFKITEAKSHAGVRDIPIHSKLQQIVERLKQTSKDGYLLSGLSSSNKYGLRSNGIGKKFGRLKKSLGFDDKYVFHSLRKSFITKLENAGVQENFTARVVGHEISGTKNISYGLYSGGIQYEVLKEVVEKVDYN